jgi:serine/threonine protein kinase
VSTPHPAGDDDSRQPDLGGREHELEGRYELLERLSSGGMGAVFRARHRQIGRSVAIKVMHAGLRDDVAMRARFVAEARLASSLTHPHVVAVTDFGIDAAHGSFLVMELLVGQTVRARMNGRSLRPRIACDVIEQAAWALRYVHSRGVLHCDLKPENLFLATQPFESQRRNHVKLIDFGLAQPVAASAAAIVGTPDYLAPECLRGESPRSNSDVYSLGVVAYELLPGRPPFPGAAALRRATGAGFVPWVPPSTIVPGGLDARADELLATALALDPAARHPTVDAFLYELRTLMSMMGMRVRRVARPSRQQPPPVGGLATQPTARRIRVEPRAPFAVPVVVRADGRELLGRTENVSRGGLFVALDGAPTEGTAIEVLLPDGHGLPPVVRAVVRWRRPGEGEAASGCGVEFLELDLSLRRRIEALLVA